MLQPKLPPAFRSGSSAASGCFSDMRTCSGPILNTSEIAVLIKDLGNVLGELDGTDPDFVSLLHFYLRVRIFSCCRSSLDISPVQLRQKQNSATDGDFLVRPGGVRVNWDRRVKNGQVVIDCLPICRGGASCVLLRAQRTSR